MATIGVGAEAEVHVEQRELLKALHWYDGIPLAMVTLAAGLAALGPSVLSLGALAAALLWGISSVIGVVQTRIYAEMSAMFPEKSGGIPIYANQGWKRYSTLVGPVATFGYWAGWSFGLATSGLIVGELIQAEWFPNTTFTFWDGTVHAGLPVLIGAGAVIVVWLINISGIKEVVRSQYLFTALFFIAVGIIIFAPPVTGNWTSSTLHFFPGGGSVLTIALVWMYVMGWTTYGTEICATMAPEFRNTTRDVWRALAASGVLLILFYVFTTLAVGGGATTAQITASPSGFYGPMINRIFAGGSDIIVVCLVASVLLVMNSCTADGGRALYQTARDGLTLKQLGVLNKNHTPARAMTLDLVVNLALVFFVASPLAVLLASNLGYFISVVFALSGFVLLRKDRPDWPRPIKLRTYWVVIAGALCLFNLVLIILAGLNPSITGYGNITDFLIGLGVLAVSLVLYFYRRVVQDHKKMIWRDRSVDRPDPIGEAMLAASGQQPMAPTASSTGGQP